MKICKIKNCDGKHSALGYCQKHYERFKRHGNTDLAKRYLHSKFCRVKGCGKKYIGKGYCSYHLKISTPERKKRWFEILRIYRKNHYIYKLHKCLVENCNNKAIQKNKYCYLHNQRIKHNLPLDLSKDCRGIHSAKGKRNFQWRGGIAEYPNHYLMKKNRLIILLHNPICEICNKKPAVEVHHKNGDKSNHKLSNLQAACHKCNTRIRFKPNNTKYYRKYGISLYEIANRINYSYTTIWSWHKIRILDNILISNPNIFSLDKV